MNHTVATPEAETVRAGINEKRFFASLQHLFSGSFSMVGELMQNARRAGASRVTFEFDPEKATMAVGDNGHGIRDFKLLIQLCESSWDEQTMLADRPFGMGLFSLLFAAREITFRSCGKRLQITLQDVIDKRALDVTPDPSAPEAGTRIELADISSALLHKQYAVPTLSSQGFHLADYALCNAIRELTCGFPIPVFVNGVEMERPYAQAVLPGEITSIGFVSIRSIHQNPERGIGQILGRGSRKLMLQGLPIGGRPFSNAVAFVHLDSTAFTAPMPDRTALYDQDAAETRIAYALMQVAKDHLVRQKAALEGKEFVRRHWTDCGMYGLQHLLNDIPWIPREAVHAITAVTEADDEVQSAFTHGAEDSNASDSDLLISREEIRSGAVTIWRNVPDIPSDSRLACLIMKIARRENIGVFDGKLDREHWLNTCTPDAHDLEFRIDAVSTRGSAQIYSGNWDHQVDIQLAREVRVSVTSKVDSTLNVEFAIENDWVLLPRDYGTDAHSQEDTFEDPHAICYLAGGDGGRGHPVDALSTFRDENEDFRDEWRDRAVAHWDSVVSGLRGESLANVVASGLNSAATTPSEGHAQHLAIVRTRRSRGYNNQLQAPAFSVVDPQRDGFWEEVARKLEAIGGDVPLDARLKAAFYAVVKPGEEEPIRT